MERVFCENCGRQRRAVEAIGAYEGTPYCEACRKADDIPEQDFVRFGGQSSVSDAGSRSQVVTPATPKAGYEVFNPKTATATGKPRCGCGAVIRTRRGQERRLVCRRCEKKQKALIDTSQPARVKWKPGVSAVIPSMKPVQLTEGVVPTMISRLDKIVQDPTNRKLLSKVLLEPVASTLNLLSDDDYEKLKPHAEHNDIARKLLAQIGMIVAVRGPKQGRLKLDAKKGDSRNLACRIRRLLRNEKIAAEVESFMKASCVVVSVGYGKQGK